MVWLSVIIMNKIVKGIMLLASSFLLFSCAISKALYLGPDDYALRAASPLSGGKLYRREYQRQFSGGGVHKNKNADV